MPRNELTSRAQALIEEGKKAIEKHLIKPQVVLFMGLTGVVRALSVA
jgi:hypothetical protein